MRVRQPLRWWGGKSYLAPKIVALMPPHTHYVEPYAGGCAVLFAKPYEGTSEIVNDLDGELINFWRVLQQPTRFTSMMRRLEATPISREEFEDAGEPSDDPIERAARLFIRCQQSFSANRKHFSCGELVRRGMNNYASKWWSCLDGMDAIHDRLKRVVIENYDAIKLIKKEDRPYTLFYCDPPYLHETRVVTDAYNIEMTAEQHEELLQTLAGIDGKFILSGYDSELYRDYAARYSWNRADIDIANHAAGGKTKRRMTEVLWYNFQA